MTELETHVQGLTVEVRELVATLKERCPVCKGSIRALEVKVWGLIVAFLGIMAVALIRGK